MRFAIGLGGAVSGACRCARRFRRSRRHRFEPTICCAKTTIGVFLPTHRCAAISGIRSNTSRLAATPATSVSAAKSAKFSNRSEMTTGENSRIRTHFSFSGTCCTRTGILVKTFASSCNLRADWRIFRTGGPRPIDEKRLDLEAAFFEVGNTQKKNWTVLRIGRQELNYGSGRLVSVARRSQRATEF